MHSFRQVAIFVLVLTSPNAFCEKVVMVFGQSLSPYVIEENNSGVELSIIKEALAFEGYELEPLYTQLGRVSFIFDQKAVDAAHRYIKKGENNTDLFYGSVTIEYHDVFFTLLERNIKIESPTDLEGYTLLSFQDANKHYPRWLPESYNHSQTSTQINQIKLLQLGLVDIVLADKNIFSYHINLYRSLSHAKIKGMRMHVFTQPYKYKPVFKSKKIAKAYNRGLKKLRETGKYTKIISKSLLIDIAITNTTNIIN